jgi:hypothetical protein
MLKEFPEVKSPKTMEGAAAVLLVKDILNSGVGTFVGRMCINDDTSTMQLLHHKIDGGQLPDQIMLLIKSADNGH